MYKSKMGVEKKCETKCYGKTKFLIMTVINDTWIGRTNNEIKSLTLTTSSDGYQKKHKSNLIDFNIKLTCIGFQSR